MAGKTWIDRCSMSWVIREMKKSTVSTLAWRIPQTEEPGGLRSTGSQRVGHNWHDWACMDAVWLQRADRPGSASYSPDTSPHPLRASMGQSRLLKHNQISWLRGEGAAGQRWDGETSWSPWNLSTWWPTSIKQFLSFSFPFWGLKELDHPNSQLPPTW